MAVRVPEPVDSEDDSPTSPRRLRAVLEATAERMALFGALRPVLQRLRKVRGLDRLASCQVRDPWRRP